MANALYNFGRESFLNGLNWATDDIRAMLVLSTYSFNAAHQYVADLGAVDNGRTGSLSGKTTTDGIADAADISITATAGSASKAIVLFKHTGSNATATLIAYIDTVTSGLPCTPAPGGAVNIEWDNGVNKIFKL